MIDPGNLDEQELPLTIRAVFIINPENKLMLSLNYPACVGRNMDEIVRCVQALQLSYEKSIATPANWPNNHADIPMPDGSRSTEFKGSVFLLPTVSEGKYNRELFFLSCFSVQCVFNTHSHYHFNAYRGSQGALSWVSFLFCSFEYQLPSLGQEG